MNNVRFDCRWSNEATPEYMSDFISVLEQVWGNSIDHDSIQCRYIDNIYGSSLIIITYVNEIPSGTQAFWRNDIDKRIGYQADDGAVLEKSRGRGLLKKMIQKGMEILGGDVLVYSYTNNKSKSSFVKLGWNVMYSHSIRPLITVKGYFQRCPQMVDYNYAKWFLHKRKHISYVKRNNKYFLVIPTSHRFVDYIISACDKQTAMLFEKGKKYSLLIYKEQPSIIDSEKKGNIVVMGYKGEYIPIWKCDAI